jgi:hypothetical protein
MPKHFMPSVDATGLENQAQATMLDQYAADLWTMIHHTAELSHEQVLEVLRRLTAAVELDRDRWLA